MMPTTDRRGVVNNIIGVYERPAENDSNSCIIQRVESVMANTVD